MASRQNHGKKVKTVLAVLSFLLVLVLLLCGAQNLLMPKYGEGNTPEGALIAEYYAEADIPHDVLFVGDCEAYESIVPAKLWEEYGISSYVRGSAQQLVWQSYWLLCEMLETETPKAVVFNVLSLKYGEPQNEAYNRMTLDGMKAGSAKWEAVRASLTEGENATSYVFPLLRYHDRWASLGAQDWQAIFGVPETDLSFSGYLMQTDIVPQAPNPSEGRELLDYTLPERAMAYLEKMRVLCEEKGVALVLVKAPTNNWRYWWYDEWDEQVSAYAAEHSLSYWNGIGNEAIGIDWSHDTYDAGVHLNVYGAEKWTSYLGSLLKETFDIPDARTSDFLCVFWTGEIEAYEKAKREKETISRAAGK